MLRLTETLVGQVLAGCFGQQVNPGRSLAELTVPGTACCLGNIRTASHHLSEHRPHWRTTYGGHCITFKHWSSLGFSLIQTTRREINNADLRARTDVKQHLFYVLTYCLLVLLLYLSRYKIIELSVTWDARIDQVFLTNQQSSSVLSVLLQVILGKYISPYSALFWSKNLCSK